MKRRIFLKNLPLTAVAATPFITPRSAMAAPKKLRWRLALGVPKTMPVWGEGMERFVKRVAELTDKQLNIKVYGAGELVPALGTFDAVRNGEIQMAHSAAYYWQGKIPASPMFTGIPFGLDSTGMFSWLAVGGGQELYDELMHPFGVTCFPCGTAGYQSMGWFNKEINTVDDLKGLKIRIPGLASQVYSKAGAKPVLLPGGEIFTSLSTGVIDAVEWAGPYTDYVMGFQKAAKYLYGPGWHEPGSIFELMINKKAFDTLPDISKAAIRTASYETSSWMFAEWTAKNGEYLEKIKAEGKVEIRTLSKDVLDALEKLANEAISEMAATSPLAQRILDSFTSFKNTRYSNYKNFAGTISS